MKKVKIGKDVIESLTLGMYEDSRFIFREYVQNSADQIDKAVELKILGSRDEGNIFINIDAVNKVIEFEDNATGIKNDDFESILTNIAQSTKDRGKDKGFRGIGRLGGLGYCEKLVFETSYKGENIKNIMVWDAKLLKEIINDRSQKEEASEVIEKITNRKQVSEDVDKHYFKVILQDVSNKELLSIPEIREYLSMVAPIPFEGHFIFKNKIFDELKKFYLSLDEYKIFINTEQIFKAYKTIIKDNIGKTKDDIFDVKFRILYSDEKPIAFVWYGISKTFELIPAKFNLYRGFRLRKGNIQIGSEYTLRKYHKDPRFHFYYIGEVHAFSTDLIPNARRDSFLENRIYKDFERELKSLFMEDLHSVTYAVSGIKSANRKVEQFENVKKIYEETKQKGFTSTEEKLRMEQQLKESKEKAEEGKKELDKLKSKYKEHEVVNKIYEKVVTTENVNLGILEGHDDENGNEKIKYRTDSLSKLDKSQRKLISRIYKVIDDKLTPDLAENIKYWIEQEFK